MAVAKTLEDIITEQAPIVAEQIETAVSFAESEEDLRIEFEKAIEVFRREADLPELKGHHEVTIGRGRADSVYDYVFIEYKKPGRLKESNDSPGNREVINQLQERAKAFKKLVNNNLLREERYGKMFLVKSGPNFDRVRKDFQISLDKWTSIIEKPTDLFMRVNTDQAEVIATVMFAADALKMETRSVPRETEVFEAVLQWKQKRQPPLDDAAVASTIRNLGMLRWLDIKPDASLPVPEEESIPA